MAEEMAELRRAVMLAHVLPGVQLRLWCGRELVAEIGNDASVAHPARGGIRQMTSCHARSAVAQAWRAGADAGWLQLGPGQQAATSIEIVLEPFCHRHAGEVYRVICAQTWVYAFLTTLDPDAVSQVLGPVMHDVALVRRIDHHHDELLGVSVLWVEVDQDPAWVQEAAVLEVLYELVARCATKELERELPELLTGSAG